MKLRTGGLIASPALGVLSTPLEAEAQQPGRPYRIGVLHLAFVPNSPQVEGLKAGLKTMGLLEGRDVAFDIRFARGNPQALPAAASALAQAGGERIFAVDWEPPAPAHGA